MSAQSSGPWETDDRIPNTTYAKHYDLYLHPDLESKLFTGRVTISISSSESRDYFLVHAKDLTIDTNSIALKRVEGSAPVEVPIAEAFPYAPNEFFVIRTASVVPPGRFQLSMSFDGTLRGKIVGFYSSEYETKEGQRIPLATTKFEPTFGRQAFPCFDEPSFRSTFAVTIVRPSDNNYIGLANMPVQSEIRDSPSKGLTEVHFQTSVSMVTYLVCFIVCDFTYKEVQEETMGGLMPFRVYAPRDKIADMEYALQFGSETLKFYETMFDFPFPLPKSDIAAIPDYSSGATEHWGIITFRETNVFYNRTTSSTQNHQRISCVIAHEFAHQWFGNLVTLKWWNDLWLNEGFASYIEFKGVHHSHPHWDMRAQFLLDNLQPVLDLDSKLSSHPIVKTVATPDEINAMFDSISYDKGSAVLRMLEGFMGVENFQKGVNQFLKDFAFQNAVTQDLWDELTAAWQSVVPAGNKTDIGDIMNTWTVQMGYPVVTVARFGSSNRFLFTQARFLKDPEAEFNKSESVYGYKWDIPITVITSKDPEGKIYWLYREHKSLEVEIPDADWFKVNSRNVGYYRVNYSPEQWAVLEELCKHLSLVPDDRSSLYDDAISLADASRLNYGIALNLTRSLINEDHYVPWTTAARRFKVMEQLLLETEVNEPFKAYVRELVEPIYTTLGWQDEGIHLRRLLRYTVVDISSMSDLSSSLNEANRLLKMWLVDPAYPLPLDTKRYVYWWGMMRCNNKEWDVMWQRCMNELDAAQKDNLYFGLSNSQDPATLEKYIDLASDLSNTKMQDFLSILKYISVNPSGRDISWNYVRKNWDFLIERYGSDDRYLGQLVPYITKYFATVEKLAEVKLFYERNVHGGAAVQYRDQALETVQNNIKWVSRYSEVINNWLSSRTRAK